MARAAAARVVVALAAAAACVVAVGVTGCATTPGGGAASDVVILDLTYTKPAALTLTKGPEGPGYIEYSYQSSATGCSGFLSFSTVTGEQSDSIVRTIETRAKEYWQKQGVAWQAVVDTPLQPAGRHLSYDLETEGYLDLTVYQAYFPDEVLSFIATVDCPLDRWPNEQQVLVDFLNSRRGASTAQGS